MRFSNACAFGLPHEVSIPSIPTIYVSIHNSCIEKKSNDYKNQMVECDGEKDHVHLLVKYPPKKLLSKLVNSL